MFTLKFALEAIAMKAGASAACVLLLITTAFAVADERRPRTFDISAQSLATALSEFARQSQQEILFAPAIVADKTTGGLRGTYPPLDALKQILGDTGLTFSTTPSGAILVQPSALSSDLFPTPSASQTLNNPEIPDPGTARKTGFWDRLRLAQADQDQTSTSSKKAEKENQNSLEDSDERMGELIVTGTNIRGVAPIGSPLVTILRDEIVENGYGTTQQVIQALPQNFGGEFSEDNRGSGGGTTASLNLTQGTSANLRGLGGQSTLTLLNGRRLPVSGFANFVDLAMIPLASVDRIDVLLDGASALYGSDAVAGVVNIVLRRDFNGAETFARYGGASQGGAEELQLSQALGGNWSGGSGVISYEHYDREKLSAGERDFVTGAPGPVDILPKTKRHSLFVTGTQDLTSSFHLFSDAFYTNRESQSFSHNGSWLTDSATKVDEYGLTVGSSFDIGADWQASAFASYGTSRVDDTNTFLGSTSFRELDTPVETLEGKLDGTLLMLPGGALKVAVGGGHRSEELSVSTARADSSRWIDYAFGELAVPVIGSRNELPGIKRLRVSLATRYERYSDFGSTANPKFGLEWAPLDWVTVRSSYGTSFRAPSLQSMSEDNAAHIIQPISYNSNSQRTLIQFGGNAGVGPEDATSWTVGLDLSVLRLPELKFSVSYFNVDYNDRIDTPIGQFFTNPGSATVAPVLTRRGDIPDSQFDALVTQLLSRPFPVFGCGVPLDATGHCAESASNIAVIADVRTQNISTLMTRGLDFSTSYRFNTAIGDLSLYGNLTYIDQYSLAFSSAAPSIDVKDTGGNPLSLRVRSGATLNSGPWNLTTAVNHSDSYRVNGTPGSARVGSWTTVDLNITRRIESGVLHGFGIGLTVNNIFDTDPPLYAASALSYVRYDQVNADPIGRHISLQVRKRW